ncbi:MAG: hypothetical protein KC457_35740, partial [Myxococcales bacterium]|nr:hypothetical protein [Myxococcales bacterium]
MDDGVAVSITAAGFASPLFKAGRVQLLPDRLGVAAALAELLRADGLNVSLGEAIDAPAVIDLRALGLGDGAEQIDMALAADTAAFELARTLAPRMREGKGTLIFVQDTGGDLGLSGRSESRAWIGIAGLAKTAACEWPEASVRVIDLEVGARSPAQLAAELYEELRAGGLEVEIGLTADGRRLTLEAIAEPLSANTQTIPEGSVFVVS